jgi:hypothetical protein
MSELSGTAKLIDTVTKGTLGDGKYPYLHLLGSTDPMTVDELHAQMLGIFDTPWTELTDDEKENPPTVTEFLSWHSGKQTAYIKYIAEAANDLTTDYVIGSGSEAIHVLLADNQERIYVIEHLQKSDIARLSLQDQINLGKTEIWLSTVSVMLDMVPTGSTTWESARDALLNDTTDVSVATLQAIIDASPAGIAGADPFDKEPFQMELDLIKTQIEGQAIFSATQIQERLSKLQERLVRVQTLYEAAYGSGAQSSLSRSTFGPRYDEDSEYTPGGEKDIDGHVFYRNSTGLYLIMDGDDYGTGNNIGDNTRDAFDDLQDDMDALLSDDPPWGGVISLDDNAKIKEVYQTLIDQERIMATAEKQAWELSQTGVLNGVKLDGPTLASNLQMLMSVRKKAQVAINTAWIDCIQHFLQQLTVFQDLVNATIEQADIDKPNQKIALLGLDSRDLTGLTDQQLRAVAMVDSFMRGGALHPVLELMGITWPEIELIDVHDDPAFSQVAGGNHTLTRVRDNLTAEELATLNLTGLDDNDFVTKVSYAPWEWKKLTKTQWDSIATRISQMTQNITKQLEILQNENSSEAKEESRAYEAASSFAQMVQSVISRISFLG